MWVSPCRSTPTCCRICKIVLPTPWTTLSRSSPDAPEVILRAFVHQADTLTYAPRGLWLERVLPQYKEFMALIANHIRVVTPFLPALTNLLGQPLCLLRSPLVFF